MSLSSTERGPLEFVPSVGELKKETLASTNKIGWLHTISDKKGASFDITIKDALGRIKMKKQNCKSETEQFGELVNLPTNMGEKLTVEIENLKGADKVQVFLN